VAAEIAAHTPPFTMLVALFVNPKQAEVEQVLARIPRIGLLQFHGTETESFCSRFGRGYVKALGMSPGIDLETAFRSHRDACGFLLDAFDPVHWGGTGQTFDWSTVPRDRLKPIILAGGLTAENVGEAIHLVHPYAVDVCGGVERAPGVKDAGKIEAFIRSVEQCLTI